MVTGWSDANAKGRATKLSLNTSIDVVLDMSGFFVVAPRSMMDKEFLSEGVDKKSIRFEQWRSLGVELLCKAVVQEKDNTFSVEAYLYDTSDGELVFGKKYGGVAPSEWRRVVHRLADDIVSPSPARRAS